MQYYASLQKVNAPGGCAVALGYFDGVHQGHRAVIGAAAAWAQAHGAQPAVFTFGLPTGSGMKGRGILSTPEKHRRIGALGVRYYMAPPFAQFCGLSPEQFVRDVLGGNFGARAVFCGEDFTFGKDKAGDVQTLAALCDTYGIKLQVVPTTLYEGQPVSSTRIRRALAEGRMEVANALLGERYCVDFTVRHGQGLGRTMGFPTINQIYPDSMQLPKQGVYITRVVLAGQPPHPGATGLGTRPTVGGEGVTCETFMPGFSGQVYGENARVEFFHYLKPTVKFDTREELSGYVHSAAQAALDYFAAPQAEF